MNRFLPLDRNLSLLLLTWSLLYLLKLYRSDSKDSLTLTNLASLTIPSVSLALASLNPRKIFSLFAFFFCMSMLAIPI